jgi:hypothetical protein
LRRVRVIRTGVHFQLPIHRLAELRLRQHPAYRFLDETDRPLLADDAGALLAQAAFVAAVLSVDFLVFLPRAALTTTT